MFLTYFINEEKTKFVSFYNGKKDKVSFICLDGKRYVRTVKYYEIKEGKTFAVVLYHKRICFLQNWESANNLNHK
jgi:hypothetical protein